MDTTLSTPEPSTRIARFKHLIFKEWLLETWMMSGLMLSWVNLTFIASATLQYANYHVLIFGLGFVPVCLVLFGATLYIWNRSRARNAFSARVRVIACCASVNIWALCCIFVYLTTENIMHVATWWFCVFPGVIFVLNHSFIKACGWSGMDVSGDVRRRED